ncbi:nucleoside hydrolase-like domain-containing protein [Persicitalea jodogahamensis]|uniref:DUF1593 domain-containing protein n=1 Tax=Persicitalea jodogahamensis TaxID=402147 RepID=A0A8J3GAP9_9BACT|nr:nucleoside hydrolase-like domain-containing protein [Persicitalea jodogahamensis]GHB84736.1 hypothetical protein GCM10007390_44890 [Persicitalea jodogahamensis]
MQSIILKSSVKYWFIGAVVILALVQTNISALAQTKPRIIISTDIGGTDPDDFQSMIHLLMYADRFQIEGLVSSPYGDGRTKDILNMIDLYEKDLSKLKKHSSGFPAPDALRAVCKQGAIKEAAYKGFSAATEGSDWIIRCARKKSDQPLWVLVWGGFEDLAQALHDAPEIKDRIRVYMIGGPNKKWGVNAYSYIAEHHPDLWMIEANATYRGWFMDPESPKNITSKAFYGNYIQGRGAMGKDFINYYKGDIKMGDTPSLAYLMKGNPDTPTGESWGGSFTPIDRSSRAIFERNTTTADTVATYSVVEWRFKGPKLAIPTDSACFTLDISGQLWPGYYLGEGRYGVRYSPKQVEVGSYTTHSSISELDGQKGKYVSVAPWPGKRGPNDYVLGRNWYGDRTEPELFLGTQQGAKTVSKHREEFLMDWAKRWEWLK